MAVTSACTRLVSMFVGNQAFQRPVVEQQVNVIVVAFHRQPVLAAHESEVRPHFGEESLNIGDQGGFELPLLVCVGEFEEVKGVVILDRQFGLRSDGLRQGVVETGLVEQVFFVGLVVDLVLQYAACPAKASSGAQVELAL